MKIPFIIYIKAVGLYALLTIPALSFPIMYIISMTYVLIYGWFSWAVFTIIYLVSIFFNLSYAIRMVILTAGVVVAVLVAFEMLEILRVEDNIWHSGGFLLFPLAAVISGWISLGFSAKKVKMDTRNHLLGVSENELSNETNLV